MGFSAPKADPKLVAEQNAAAASARSDRISLIQNQLDTEDQLRASTYGTRGVTPQDGGFGTGNGPTGPGGSRGLLGNWFNFIKQGFSPGTGL